MDSITHEMKSNARDAIIRVLKNHGYDIPGVADLCGIAALRTVIPTIPPRKDSSELERLRVLLDMIIVSRDMVRNLEFALRDLLPDVGCRPYNPFSTADIALFEAVTRRMIWMETEVGKARKVPAP